MKKLFLFAGIMMLCSLLKAQHTHVNFGVKGGLNIATLRSNSDDVNYKWKPSFNVGALAHIHVAEHIAIQPELMYSGQGAKYSLLGDDVNINLSYINLPVLFQYMFGDGFRLQTGPQVGFLLSANSKVSGNSTDINDDLNTIDFSWVFGASFVTPSGIGADFRYNLGISNINNVDADKIRNSVFAVGLFYQFKGKEL